MEIHWNNENDKILVQRTDDHMAQTLKDVGERNLIELIKSIVQDDTVDIPLGDDCAVLDMGERYLLVSTDMISKRTHLCPAMSYKDIGWFVTAINLSDIAAKGGTPLGVLLAYGLSKDMPIADFKEIVKGADDCAKTYHSSIIGGDTKEHTDMVISGTSIGIVDKTEFMGRAGAKPDDIIVVTGELGKAASGFLSMQEGKTGDDLKGLIHPIPRIIEGRKLAKSKKVHCCIDVSDGLSTSLYELQRFNDVGFQIDYSKIPVDPMLVMHTDQRALDNYLLHFGGEYELLACIPSDDLSYLQKKITPTPLSMIGKVTKDTAITIKKEGTIKPLENKGYEHFSRHEFS